MPGVRWVSAFDINQSSPLQTRLRRDWKRCSDWRNDSRCTAHKNAAVSIALTVNGAFMIRSKASVIPWVVVIYSNQLWAHNVLKITLVTEHGAMHHAECIKKLSPVHEFDRVPC